MEYNNYLNTQKNFREKWVEFYSLPPNFNHTHFQTELTPLNGSIEFSLLTQSEKERFFLEYIKLVSEALVFFEQLLVLGVWAIEKRNKKRNFNIDSETLKALRQFTFEELYHSNGFRHFLSIHSEFNWNQNKIYADSKFLRKIISKVVLWSPSAVFLPGAKLEAFTLSYHKMIKKYYPSNRENSWIHLNHIHQIDEAHHLPLEFDLHDAIVDKVGAAKTLIGGILFVLIMQVALFIGSFKVVHYSFPKYSFLKKISWTLKMAKWAVRTTPAYSEARVITKRQFAIKRPKYGKLMSFIYW